MIIDRFFWKPPTIADIVEAEVKKDIDDFILVKLNSLRASLILLDDSNPILTNNYLDNFWKITIYFITLRWPSKMDTKEFNAFKKKLLNSKSKIITFFVEITKIYLYVKLLMIL